MATIPKKHFDLLVRNTPKYRETLVALDQQMAAVDLAKLVPAAGNNTPSAFNQTTESIEPTLVSVPRLGCPTCGKPQPAPKNAWEALQRVHDELGGI